MFVCLFFVTLPGRRAIRSSATYFEQVLCRGLWVDFDTVYIVFFLSIFRLDALALSVIATATWLGGWLSVTAGIVSKRLNLS